MQVLRTATLLQRESSTGFFLWIYKLFKNSYSVEDLWKSDSETLVCLFKNTFFYRSSPLAASHSFRFPACNFIKKETLAKMFFCEFCTIFKNIFWENTSGWLLLVFISQFWEVVQITSFIGHLWETFRVSTTRCSKKVFHKCFSNILYKSKK